MLLTQRDSGGHGPAVDPEGHPGQHDHQGGREVGLEQEEEDVATQREVDVQAVVPACGTQEEERMHSIAAQLPHRTDFIQRIINALDACLETYPTFIKWKTEKPRNKMIM